MCNYCRGNTSGEFNYCPMCGRELSEDLPETTPIDLYIKDNLGGGSSRVHKIGSDSHDTLHVKDGKVEYYNLQCGEGTPDSYSFVDYNAYLESYSETETITPDKRDELFEEMFKLAFPDENI